MLNRIFACLKPQSNTAATHKVAAKRPQSQSHQRRRLLWATPWLFGLAALPPATLAAYPERPVRIVVPYSPGGAVDGVARQVAEALAKQFNSPFVIDNRPGAGALIGIEAVARANPDGYTALVVDPAVVVNPSLRDSVPYELSDLKAVAILTASPLVLVTTAESPFQTFTDVLGKSRSGSGGVTYASPGIGTTPHMTGEMLTLQEGAELVHVPYKGSGQALADIVSGEVDVGLMSITAATPFMRQGRMRGLATSGVERSTHLPDLPTIAEATQSDFNVLFWTGLFVPANTPENVVNDLRQGVSAILNDPAFVQALSNMGETSALGLTNDPEAFVNAESERWAKVIAEQGIKHTD